MAHAPTSWSPTALCAGLDYSVAKLADALDFFRPEVIGWIRAVGEEPRFHSKQWEFAQVLEARKRYMPDAGRLLGLGCGRDLIIPLLARGAEEILATDLYGMEGAWTVAAVRPDRVYPEVKNLRVHSMDMCKIDLPPASFDFIWSLCAVEHTGPGDRVISVVREAGKLLRPGGVMVLTTEYTFGKKPYHARGGSSGTFYFDDSSLRRLFTETDLHLVEPLDVRLSTHPMNVPVWDRLNDGGMPNVPHVVYRRQPLPFWGIYAGCVCVVLSREDHGNDRLIEDPARAERLAPLFELGRRTNRRLAPPTRWW